MADYDDFIDVTKSTIMNNHIHTINYVFQLSLSHRKSQCSSYTTRLIIFFHSYIPKFRSKWRQRNNNSQFACQLKMNTDFQKNWIIERLDNEFQKTIGLTISQYTRYLRGILQIECTMKWYTGDNRVKPISNSFFHVKRKDYLIFNKF